MTRGKWLIIIGAYCFILLGGWFGSQLEVDFSITTLSKRNSEEYKNYQEYSKHFPIIENGLAICLGANEKFDERSDFQKIEKLRLKLDSLPGVKEATAITSIEIPERTLLGRKQRSLLRIDSERTFGKSFAELEKYGDVTPKFLSKNHKATRLFLEVDWKKASLKNIQKETNKFDFSEAHFMGKEVFNDEISNVLKSEAITLPLIAGIALLVFFFAWFRDFKSLIIVTSILALNIALLNAFFWMTGIKIGLLTSTAPLLIVVLSFSDVVHILYKFKQETDRNSLEKRIKNTFEALRFPLWLTSVTTILAFALFFISGIQEIMEFASATCIGILMAYLTARFLLPIFLRTISIQPFKKRAAFTQLSNTLIGLLRYRKLLIIGVSALTVWFSVNLIRIFEINTSFHQSFGNDTKLGKTLRFLDEHFEGVRTIEVILTSDRGLTIETMKKVERIEKSLLEMYKCRSVFSVNTSIKRLNRYEHFGKASFFKLPETISKEFTTDLIKYKKELGLMNALSDDQRIFRIVGRLPDIGSAEAKRRNDILNKTIKGLEDSKDTIFISGFSFVKDQSTMRITGFILIGVVLSLLIAGIVIGLVFKSIRMGFIAIIPNAIPILFALILLQWMQIELNPTSAMALSILLGLSLDDTIYFLASLRRNSGEKRVSESIKENTFPAAVTSFILMIGFGVLVFSSVESNRNIGILVGTMLFIALISDLIILPAFLKALWVTKERKN